MSLKKIKLYKEKYNGVAKSMYERLESFISTIRFSDKDINLLDFILIDYYQILNIRNFV